MNVLHSVPSVRRPCKGVVVVTRVHGYEKANAATTEPKYRAQVSIIEPGFLYFVSLVALREIECQDFCKNHPSDVILCPGERPISGACKEAPMKVREGLTKPSESNKVDAYMSNLKHPLAGVAKALREIILKTDPEIGEEIKWNAPAFFYMGELPPFNPKEFKRHIVVFNFYKKDCIRLVFPSGARVQDKSGLLEGDYPDGRRLALFHDIREVESRKAVLQRLVKQWLATLEKD